MDVRVENKENCVKVLNIVISEGEVEQEYENVFKEFKNDIIIPGFRKGKFPRKLFERKYADTIEKDVVGRIKETYIEKAFEQEKITSVVEPVIENEEFDRTKPFEFTVRVEVKPAFEVPDLEKITLEAEEREATDEMVETQIGYLQEQRHDYKPKSGKKVSEGDRLKISFVITVDGEEVDSQDEGILIASEGGSIFGQVDNYPDAVIGVEKGKDVIFKTKLPAYYPKKECQGAEAEVKVTVNSIEEKILPEIDSEAFLKFCGVDTADELKTKMKAELEKSFEEQQKTVLYTQIYDYFNDNTEFEIPPTLLEAEIESRKRRLRNSLKSQSKTDEEIEKEIEKSMDDFNKEAARTIKNFFILEKIGEDNTIVATEEEVDSRIASIALQQRVAPGDMKQHLAQTGGIGNIRSAIKEEKTLDLVITKAEVKKVKPKEDKEKKTAKKSSASGKKKATAKKTSTSTKKKATTKKSSAGTKKAATKKKTTKNKTKE